MSAFVFEKSFDSELYKVKPVLISALDFLHSEVHNLSIEDEYDLRLVFSELLFNAIMHGNNMDPLKKVHFSIQIVDNVLIAFVCDEGMGFEHKALIESFNSDDGLYSEHGRGIRLAYALADELTFNRAGNEIRFYKKLRGMNTFG